MTDLLNSYEAVFTVVISIVYILALQKREKINRAIRYIIDTVFWTNVAVFTVTMFEVLRLGVLEYVAIVCGASLIFGISFIFMRRRLLAFHITSFTIIVFSAALLSTLHLFTSLPIGWCITIVLASIVLIFVAIYHIISPHH